MERILFTYFGTGGIAVSVLDELEQAGFLPAHIVTGEDKPAGRGKALTPPPVKEWALKRGIECSQPGALNDSFVATLHPSARTLIIVADYGRIIPKTILELPEYGVLNMHPSLLPRFRGPSPIRSAILAGEKTYGVTIMVVDEKMDHGPVVAQREVSVQDTVPRGHELDTLLSRAGGKLLAEILPKWIRGEIEPREQEHDAATYTKKLLKEDAEIILADDAEANLRKIRAFDDNPRPYFFARRGEKQIRVVITEAHVENNALKIDRVIPEGKKEMAYEDFTRSGAIPL